MLLLQEIDLENKDKKWVKNLGAYRHLSKIENPHMEIMSDRVMNDKFLDGHHYRVG